MPSKRSVSLVAKRRETSSWSSASMLTAKNPPSSFRCSYMDVRFSTHIRTRGGSSDREENALTVIPRTLPSLPAVVTTVTPLAKWPRAVRNSSLPTGIFSSVLLIFVDQLLQAFGRVFVPVFVIFLEVRHQRVVKAQIRGHTVRKCHRVGEEVDS